MLLFYYSAAACGTGGKDETGQLGKRTVLVTTNLTYLYIIFSLILKCIKKQALYLIRSIMI